MRTAGEDPGACTDLERGLGHPKGTGHGQVRHGLRLDALHFLRNETEAVAQVYDSGLDATARLRGEHQTGGLLLANADAKEVNLELWLFLFQTREGW